MSRDREDMLQICCASGEKTQQFLFERFALQAVKELMQVRDDLRAWKHEEGQGM